MVRVPHNTDTRDLYRAEAKARAAVRESALMLADVLGYDRARQFWTHALPHALRDLLDAWDCHAAELAALDFLERRGYTVTRPAAPPVEAGKVTP